MYFLIFCKFWGILVKKVCFLGDMDVGKLNYIEFMLKNSNVVCCINNKKCVIIFMLEYVYVIGSYKNC